MEIDIRPLIEHYGSDVPPLSLGGRWKKVNCINPKHIDKNASANTNGYGFRCHGCGLAGDAIRLVMRLEDTDSAGAKRQLAQILGDSFTEVQQPAKRQRRRVSSVPGNYGGGDDKVPVGGRRRPGART